MRYVRSAAVFGAAAVAAMVTTGASTKSAFDDNSNDLRRAIDSGRAQNVILFLGDGMGDSENAIARNYLVGRSELDVHLSQ
jgi:alkaline phosphatase